MKPTRQILTEPAHADGTRRGDPIPGSKYFRDRCAVCGEWIRVPSERVFRKNHCRDCVSLRGLR